MTMSRMLFKAGRTFVFTLMCLCLLGGCMEGQDEQAQELDRIINEPAMYTVETVQDCNPGLIITHHNCTAFEIQEGNFVCYGQGYDEDHPERGKPIRIPPDTGCTWNQPVVVTGY